MRDVKLWCSTSSQVNCTRSNSLVLYFLMPVMIDLVSIFSSEQYLAIMNPPESSLVLVTAGLEWPLLHSDFSLTVFNSWVCVVWKYKCFKLVWEVHLGFLQLQQFPPVKSLTAGLGCATLTAVEPQKDSVTPCCSLTSSAYNAFSITIPSAGFPSRLVMDVLLFACIKAERIYLNALSQGSTLSYIFSPPPFCFKFLDLDSVSWNMNTILYYVQKAAETLNLLCSEVLFNHLLSCYQGELAWVLSFKSLISNTKP